MDFASQFSGTLDPRWFGVIGDGRTDDTVAYQTCVDVAASLANAGATFIGNLPSKPVTIDHNGLKILVSDRINIPAASDLTFLEPYIIAADSFPTDRSLYENVLAATDEHRQNNTAIRFIRPILDANHTGGCIYFSGDQATLLDSGWFLHFGSSGADRTVAVYFDRIPVFSAGQEIRNCRFDEYVAGEDGWNNASIHFGVGLQLSATDAIVTDCYFGYGHVGILNDGQFNRFINCHDYSDLGSSSTENAAHQVWENFYIDKGDAHNAPCLTIVNPFDCKISVFGLATDPPDGYAFIVLQAVESSHITNGLVIQGGLFVVTSSASGNTAYMVKSTTSGAGSFSTNVTASYIGNNAYVNDGDGAFVPAFTEVRMVSPSQSSTSSFVFTVTPYLPLGEIKYVFLNSDCGASGAGYLPYTLSTGLTGLQTVVTVDAKTVTYAGSTPTVGDFTGRVFMVAGVCSDGVF